MSRKGSPLITKEPEYSENTDIQWALDLLKPDPNHELSILQKYASEVVCMGSGFAIACLRNNLNRRPIFAGLQIHGVSMAIGYIVAQVANKVIDHFKVERDTRLRSYVMLHPELFPEPKQVKYADVLKSWDPVR